jgi:hypothetical protein
MVGRRDGNDAVVDAQRGGVRTKCKPVPMQSIPKAMGGVTRCPKKSDAQHATRRGTMLYTMLDVRVGPMDLRLDV